MKLSEKGCDKVLDWYAEQGQVVTWKSVQKIDFDSDDFEEMVILTVEEASEIWDSLVNLVSYVESIEGGRSDLVRDGQRNIDLIRIRIKKAEERKNDNAT